MCYGRCRSERAAALGRGAWGCFGLQGPLDENEGKGLRGVRGPFGVRRFFGVRGPKNKNLNWYDFPK